MIKLLHHLNYTLERIDGFLFLVPTIFLFFLLRLPSLFEPLWYGDEGIYQVIGMAMADGRLLYRDIWDNKPPLLYIVYMLFSSDQFAVRFASLIFGILSIVSFFSLAKELFLPDGAKTRENKNGKRIVYCTTLGFAILFGLPLLEGNIANAENFMLFPIITAGLLLVRFLKTPSTRLLVVAGLLLSTGFLLKAVGIFDFVAFTLFLLIVTYKNGKKEILQLSMLFPYVISFAIPIAFTIVYFILAGAFWDFFTAVFRQNVGYVGYANNLFIPQGLLVLKLILLTGLTVLLFVKRHTLSTTALFIFLWFALSTFNAFFSGRPYTHYMLVLLPSFMLLIGFLFWKPSLHTSQRFGALVLVVISLLLFVNFRFYEKTIPYYQNYLAFITMQKDVDAYRAFFDRSTPKDYSLAQFIQLHADKNDTIFIWGNNAQLYTLTKKLPPGRYIVAYHMTASKDTLQETEKALQRVHPRFIAITSQQKLIPFSLSSYRQRIIISDAIIYERIF